MRGFKIAQGKLGQKILAAWQRIQQLEKRRATIPKPVPVQTLTEEPVVKLAPERKHLTNLIKDGSLPSRERPIPVGRLSLPEGRG